MGKQRSEIKRPVVGVCSGKDCQKRSEHAPLLSSLTPVCDVRLIGCVGLCESPVVIVSPNDKRAVVLEKVRKKAERKDLVDLVETGAKPSGGLKKLRVNGSRRTKVLKRCQKRLGR